MGGAVSLGSHGNAPPRYVRPKARDPAPIIADIAVDAKRRRRVIPPLATITPPRQQILGTLCFYRYSNPALMSRAHRGGLPQRFLRGRIEPNAQHVTSITAKQSRFLIHPLVPAKARTQLLDSPSENDRIWFDFFVEVIHRAARSADCDDPGSGARHFTLRRLVSRDGPQMMVRRFNQSKKPIAGNHDSLKGEKNGHVDQTRGPSFSFGLIVAMRRGPSQISIVAPLSVLRASRTAFWSFSNWIASDGPRILPASSKRKIRYSGMSVPLAFESCPPSRSGFLGRNCHASSVKRRIGVK
jgi:hypothetical protein